MFVERLLVHKRPFARLAHVIVTVQQGRLELRNVLTYNLPIELWDKNFFK